jgi:hypothetical protein
LSSRIIISNFLSSDPVLTIRAPPHKSHFTTAPLPRLRRYDSPSEQRKGIRRKGKRKKSRNREEEK